MPRELNSMEEIDEKLLSRTSLVYRKAVKEGVKYKFRTKRTIFTYLADNYGRKLGLSLSWIIACIGSFIISFLS
mgnify:CR=1 FL=1